MEIDNGQREARKFKRFEIETRVAVLRSGRFRIERSVDLSEGGMMIKSSQPYDFGETIELNFFLVQSFVRAKAEVIYTLPEKDGVRCIGVRFLSLSAQAAEAIREMARDY